MHSIQLHKLYYKINYLRYLKLNPCTRKLSISEILLVIRQYLQKLYSHFIRYFKQAIHVV